MPVWNSQLAEFVGGKLEHEVWRKARSISFDRANQLPGGYAVELRKVCVQHHGLSTDEENLSVES
jgi:hypothetical protein